MSCEEELPWNGGSTLFSYVSSVKFDGLTGPVSFAENKRTDFKLDFLKLKESSLEKVNEIATKYYQIIMFRVDIHHKVGEWTPAGGLNISDKYAFSHGRPPNITLRVMSRIEHPFVMKTTAKDGNDRFEVRNCSIQRIQGRYKVTFHCYFEQGFCIDVLEHIAEIAGFNYHIELVPDNNYGALNLSSGKWNGLVKGE